MKRFLLASSVVGLMIAALAFSGNGKKADEFQADIEARNPWTHQRFNNGSETFHFAVVSDRTGGHRARVFSQAVDSLNLLQPTFVVSVGDLIEGYTKDKAKLADEWKEFQSYAGKLQMPFFYVPGNHDVSNMVEVEEWKSRFGRPYYHFVYRDVLFLAMCSDDQGEDKEYGQISQAQVEYFEKALQANSKVRWTVVLIHKPVWSMTNFDKNRFQAVEKALAGRNYTVFAGHVHRYQKFVRNGMNYYQLATTGGGSKMRGMEYREFDHIAWVTMKKDGPTIANLMLDGIYPEDLKRTVSAEEGHVLLNRKAVTPAHGKVAFQGTPVGGAKINFYILDAKKKYVSVADAFADSDGSFTMSTYKAYDGAPVGEYFVTVVQRLPYYTEDGSTGKDLLPAKYVRPEDSGITVKIEPGPNEIKLNLE